MISSSYLAPRAVALCGALFLAGCIQVGPKDLNVPSRGMIAHLNPVRHPIAEKSPRDDCPEPNEPPPIPETAHIIIEPGKPVQADAGGEALLRAYVAMRERKRL